MDLSQYLIDPTITPINHRNKIDGLTLLHNIKTQTVKVIFFDPQYRGVLDKLKYGNEGKNRGKDRHELEQMNEETIIKFITEIDRVLLPSGHLFLWIDKFHLCQGVLPWISNTSLNLVDMIVWNKCKIGMGYRSRRQCEYLMIMQKSPIRAKDCWLDHTIPDVWSEKLVNKNHTHSKPIELQKALIKAVSNENDLILDPASGGYSVLQACIDLNRIFLGGDLKYGE